ncbi:UDP-N-acetylglucosamine 2-epimerase, partial [Methylicorpusculum sp.]|uniref:UDP-N-acetylglucosamine 2-epimerase n=1 Tax=Methylicorpusculum sp. TaxID=2713644 RepID=UPI002AB8BB17
KIPTVNIGDRQKGRLQTNSVINCATECQVIYESILIALKTDCKDTVNPYGEGDSSIRIKKVLKDINQPDSLLKKSFFELKYHAN